MHPKLFQLKCFITYWLDAVDEHSLHSPYLFDLYTNVITPKFFPAYLDTLKDIRKNFEHDHRTIHVSDLGAGSVHLKSSDRKVSDIARVTSTSHKFSMLYSRIIRYSKFKHIIELGTSLGINALCLANADEHVHVTTFEGSREVGDIAMQLFQDYHAVNVQLIMGNIDETLGPYLTTIQQFDFALIDANHRIGPTLQYMELLMNKIHAHSIIVLDDIHYSPEMESAWHTIQKHERVYMTIDLYRCGLIFFNPSLTKQNVVLQF